MANIQPDIFGRAEYHDNIVMDVPESVQIPGTKKVVKIRGMKAGTMEFLTRLWVERDLGAVRIENSSETLKAMCQAPFFSIKMACAMALNSYWKLKLVWPLKWRWWAYVKEYTEEQMSPIITVGKKKIPLEARLLNTVLLMDMRTDQMTMQKKQAEQYRAELLLAEQQRLSKTSQSSEGQGASSSV